MTPLEAAQSGTPKLYEAARFLGKEAVTALLDGLLVRFLQFSGAEWAGESIDDFGTLMTGSHANLTIAQWRLFFEKAKSGKLAQQGNRGQTMIARVTPLILAQWLQNFAAECEDANEVAFAQGEAKRIAAPTIEHPEAKYVTSEMVQQALDRFAADCESADAARRDHQEAEKKRRSQERYKQALAYAAAAGVDLKKFRDNSHLLPDGTITIKAKDGTVLQVVEPKKSDPEQSPF